MVVRRTVLKAIAGTSVATVFAGKLTGLSAIAADAAPLLVRRNLHGMKLDDPDLSAYREFVSIMKSKNQTQPLSWLGYANQHGSLNGGFKYCPHGDWYFLPWHRGFMLMYERAVAALTGYKSFAMPYWNWTEDRLLPEAFTAKTYNGKPNPLYVPNRNDLTGPYALTDAIVGQKEVMDKIYAETNFEVFGTSRSVDRSVQPPLVQNSLDPKWVPMGGGTQGILERTPHNTVHNNIGAFMPTAASPRDPVFMMHHGNIDRVWATWNALGRKNSTDPLWLGMKFPNNYIDPQGRYYTQGVSDLLSTEALGYRYDVLPRADNKVVNTARAEHLLALFKTGDSVKLADHMKLRSVLKGEHPAATAVLPLNSAVQFEAGTVTGALSADADTGKTTEVVALIKNIRMSENVISIRVFVNLPDASLDVPETNPHYVTTLSFLTHAVGHDHHALPSTMVDLTDTLKTLNIRDDNFSINLVAVPKPGVAVESSGSVTAESIEVAVI
ncbi:tyrosinase family protein [Ralstonia solanacearum]|uniref:tyrosinase family protein n=1 Tax=Ralstonia solanacearum TaxID=305 RepID=UPI0004B02471|nr:tyrosinase family protein [Ralstonia solanacearum]AMP74617.1 polyphenol oxidase [Ralstonia solanacearum]MCL9827704.1 tyrosinase family protein [Ralstonia solanacearum]MCL9832424.1 tyrosinase family protein [Ralstonia solanacearum]MCL9837205.1 tyrosinase family protein [Ralstonia solanacearum]MCL9843185.1 tyrosinase family protein [Ralstonia solanacearum]